MQKQLEFDVIILGGGPAGFSAGLYAARGNVKTAIVDINMMGGQPSNYLEIENYPGYATIGGYDLMEKFEEHADKFGIEKFPMQDIQQIDLLSNPKKIIAKDTVFLTKTLIIATGAKSQKLDVPGEDKYIGLGVSYCAVCDGAFFRDKVVSVVGGGNAAVEEAIYLTKFAKKVYIIHRRNQLRADKVVQERAFANDKIEFVYDTVVTEVLGDKTVNKIQVKNVKTEAISTIETDGIFPYIGLNPNIEYINSQIKQNEKGFIVTDETMQTSVEGVWAVGDVRVTPLRQVITAAADGAIAAVYAIKHLETLEVSEESLVKRI